jgi:hypothetical protein
VEIENPLFGGRRFYIETISSSTGSGRWLGLLSGGSGLYSSYRDCTYSTRFFLLSASISRNSMPMSKLASSSLELQ